jgi:hypothetical protein
MEGEETCFPVFGMSVLTVGLYLQLLNTECVLTVCKLLNIHSETIIWHASVHFHYLIIKKLQIGPFTIIQNVPIEESFDYMIGPLELGLGSIILLAPEFYI